jgi:hypothetical protein
MMRFRSVVVLLLLACGGGGDDAASNGAAPPRAGTAGGPAVSDATGVPGEVPLKIELSAGGDRAELAGAGRCTHAAQASIYGVPAALWQIQDSGTAEIGHATLTVWRPASGGGADQFSMVIASGDRQHRISTVKGGEIVGSGSVAMHPTGDGAHFEVVGTDGEGRSIRATFQCERFTEHVAEGG